MLSFRTTTKCLSRSKLSGMYDAGENSRTVHCVRWPTDIKQNIGPCEETFPGVYMKTPAFKSFGSPMCFSNSILPGGYNQVRFAYTDTMPKLYKVSIDVDKYKQDKEVPMSVQKNIVGYSTALLAGGSAVLMGKAIFDSLIAMLGPDKLLQAASVLTVDISRIEMGEYAKYRFRGKTIIVQHRTPEAISEMKKVKLKDLYDPETDEQRFPRPQWLIIEAVCPHLGCIPTVGDGDFHGFFCPCHGSHFDKSGRIRKGPSPKNLRVPIHHFVDDTTIVLGSRG